MIFGFQLGESFGSVALKHYRERNKNVSHFLPKKPQNKQTKKNPHQANQTKPQAFQISLPQKWSFYTNINLTMVLKTCIDNWKKQGM